MQYAQYYINNEQVSKEEFDSYGSPECLYSPDPTINFLLGEIKKLQKRLDRLEDDL